MYVYVKYISSYLLGVQKKVCILRLFFMVLSSEKLSASYKLRLV